MFANIPCELHVNPKRQYNYSINNYISELLMANSVVIDGEFLLEWYKYFGQPQVWYVSLCSTAWAFDLRCESVADAIKLGNYKTSNNRIAE